MINFLNHFSLFLALILHLESFNAYLNLHSVIKSSNRAPIALTNEKIKNLDKKWAWALFYDSSDSNNPMEKVIKDQSSEPLPQALKNIQHFDIDNNMIEYEVVLSRDIGFEIIDEKKKPTVGEVSTYDELSAFITLMCC
jgi:hypothetical protein